MPGRLIGRLAPVRSRALACFFFDLQCLSGQHVFEGWFASESDFLAQCQRALVECPLCGDVRIVKRLSAPRLNLGRINHAEIEPSAVLSTDVLTALQESWLETSRQILRDTEDVGGNFAHEASQIHYGESTKRGIRGLATLVQTASLIQEGISVMPLALPEILKKTLQ